MNPTVLGLSLILLLPGASPKVNVPEAKCRVFVAWNNHKVTTWVNDEPVSAWDNVCDGSNKLFFFTLHKGVNYIHFTAERLPVEKTKEFAGDLPSDGSTTIKLRFGGIFGTNNGKPFSYNAKDLLVWKATKDAETSHHWTVYFETSFRPPLDQFDPVTEISEGTRPNQEFSRSSEGGIEMRNLSKVGVKESDSDRRHPERDWRKGRQTLQYLFLGAVLCGCCTDGEGWDRSRQEDSMVYRPDGKAVFFAGRDPGEPLRPAITHSSRLMQSILYWKVGNYNHCGCESINAGAPDTRRKLTPLICRYSSPNGWRRLGMSISMIEIDVPLALDVTVTRRYPERGPERRAGHLRPRGLVSATPARHIGGTQEVETDRQRPRHPLAGYRRGHQRRRLTGRQTLGKSQTSFKKWLLKRESRRPTRRT